MVRWTLLHWFALDSLFTIHAAFPGRVPVAHGYHIQCRRSLHPDRLRRTKRVERVLRQLTVLRPTSNQLLRIWLLDQSRSDPLLRRRRG